MGSIVQGSKNSIVQLFKGLNVNWLTCLSMKFINFLTLIFLAGCLWPGCTEDPPPALSYKDREVVDSLFRMRVDTLRPRYDSLCAARMDSMVQRNVDSIMEERLGEIEKYLERIKREEKSIGK